MAAYKSRALLCDLNQELQNHDPFGAAQTRIGNVWEYPPPPPRLITFNEVCYTAAFSCVTTLRKAV